MRAGLIRNPTAYRNRGARLPSAPEGLLAAEPGSHAELEAVLAGFADAGVELLLIESGDGTIRDVLSRIPGAFGPRWPRLAIVPAGKTNALALDLGVRLGVTSEQVLRAALGGARLKRRSPIEVFRGQAGQAALRGYVFGAGAFVHATERADRTHRLKLIDDLAVGVILTSSALAALTGRSRSSWSRPVRIGVDGGPDEEAQRFLLLASTLKRFPLNLRPFGEAREGLKLLQVSAPPRRLVRAIGPILSGSWPAWLGEAGYSRSDCEEIRLHLPGGFVLDGEVYPGGEVTLRQGPALEFVVP